MRFKQKAFIYFGLFLMVFTATASLLPRKALAYNTSSSIVNAATIKINQFKLSSSDYSDVTDNAKKVIKNSDQLNKLIETNVLGTYSSDDINGLFYKSDPLKPQGHQWFHNGPDKCESKIKFQDGRLELVNISLDLNQGGCTDILKSDHGISPNNLKNLQVWFEWQASNAIARVDGRDGYFVYNASTKTYVSSHKTGDCKDNVKLITSSRLPSNPNTDLGSFHKGCIDPKGVDLGLEWKQQDPEEKKGWGPEGKATYIGGQDNKKKAAVSSTDDSSLDIPKCESKGISISWIVCGIVNWLASATDAIYTLVIVPWLNVDTLGDIANPDTTIFKSWSNLRVIGNIVLVIAMLVIVFGQAIGGGMIDAYTAKKVMPRILIAAILVNLSIYIVAAAIDVTNVLGHGLTTVFYQVMAVGGDQNITLNGGASAGLGLTTIAAGGAAIWFAGPALVQAFLLFVLLPGFLAMLGVMFTLIMRQGIITALVIVSPIAFALYCLPAGERFFKQWWSLLFKTLLVYPIISMIFGVSRILAVTTSESAAGHSGLTAVSFQFASILLIFIPIFLIPYAFKMAGGAIGSIYGTLSGFSKKATEGIKGSASNPNSLRNSVKHRLYNDGRDRRANIGSALRGRPGVNRNAVTQAGARLVGGGSRTVAGQAARNEERMREISQVWSSGDDTYAKGSTISLNSLAERRQSGYRYRAAAADGSRAEQWEAADGTWISENEIREGNRAYRSGADKQANFLKLGEKTEALDTEHQDRVLEDYVQFANDARLDPGLATGRWQGISIPLKNMRLDQRRAQFGTDPATGRLAVTGVNHEGLLTEYSNMAMHEQVKETPGTFDALATSMETAFNPIAGAGGPTAGAAGQINPIAAGAAYHNLVKYVGSAGGAATAAAAAASAAAGAPAGVPGAPASYSSSSSAAAKNAGAAREALDRVQADPALRIWLENNAPPVA